MLSRESDGRRGGAARKPVEEGFEFRGLIVGQPIPFGEDGTNETLLNWTERAGQMPQMA